MDGFVFPETLRDLFVLVFSPAFFGAIVSWIAANWEWFVKLESGKKVALLLVVAVLYGTVNFLLNRVLSPEWFDQLDPYYQSILPFLAYVVGQWVFHSQVNQARANAKVGTAVKVIEASSTTYEAGVPAKPVLAPGEIPPLPGTGG